MRRLLLALSFANLAVLECVLAATQSDVNNAVSGDPVYQEYSVCSEKCEKSFAPHTNPDVASLNACKRGCRFSLIAAVSEHNNGAKALNVCKEGCRGAYSAEATTDGLRRYACDVGCTNNVWEQSYQEMLEQEMCSWIMLANYLQYVHHRLVSNLPSHTRLVSLFVASNGQSGVYVSGSIEEVKERPKQEPPVTGQHKGEGVKFDRNHILSWLFCAGFSLIIFYVFLDCTTICVSREEAEDVQLEKTPLSKSPKEISLSLGAPSIPPGKLVEVIVQEV